MKIETWKSKDGFRWRFISRGRITGESGEGYKTRRGCMKTLTFIIQALCRGDYTIHQGKP